MKEDFEHAPDGKASAKTLWRLLTGIGKADSPQTWLKSGLRLSMKAVNASRAAGSCIMRRKLVASSSICWLTFAAVPCFIRRLVSTSAVMGLAASLRA